MEDYVLGAPEGTFTDSRVVFESVLAMLASQEAGALSHAELEERLFAQGRELLRTLLQDHLHLRAVREVRVDAVTGSDGVERRAAEPGHRRTLATVFGEVVERIAYRAKGTGNLHPADAMRMFHPDFPQVGEYLTGPSPV